MGAMRLAQTAGYGTLPSPDMPNTFLAQAFDLDDKWGPGAGPCQTDASKGGWACCDYSWGLAGAQPTAYTWLWTRPARSDDVTI